MVVLGLMLMLEGKTSSKNYFFEEFSRVGLFLMKVMGKGRWLQSSRRHQKSSEVIYLNTDHCGLGWDCGIYVKVGTFKGCSIGKFVLGYE